MAANNSMTTADFIAEYYVSEVYNHSSDRERCSSQSETYEDRDLDRQYADVNGNDASYIPANVSRHRRHGVAELPRNMTDWKNRNDDKNSNNIKKANTQKSCLSKFKRRYHSTTSLNARLSSSAQSANYEPTAPANDHREKSSAINEKCLSLSLTDLANAKCSTEQTTNRMNILDKNKLSFEDFDIVGESFEARFPWQRDIAIQCNMINLEQNRHKVVDKNMNLPANKSSQYNHSAKNVSFELESERKQRPRSISTVENAYLTHKADQMRRRNKTKKHMSDPFPNRNFNHLSRKPQTILQEEFGSISDLESIWEDPCDNAPFELTRHNGQLSEDDQALNDDHAPSSSDLLRLMEQTYYEVLPSPRISPESWQILPEVVVTSDSEASSGVVDLNGQHPDTEEYLLAVPKKTPRRVSSGSLTSGSDDSDCEPSPPVARRGRRPAIFDSKNFGDVSPTTLSPELSPSNSCDEGEGASNIAGRLRRRRSSVDLPMNIYPGDLLVQQHHKKLLKRNTIADFNAPKHGGSTVSLSEDSKKGRQPFSLLKLMRTRSKESLPHLEDVLAKLRPSEFKDNHLAAYKNLHWSDLIASTDKDSDVVFISETERKRREAVWELFKSECVFLIDHLMVLKHCFMEPLKRVQVEGFLMFAEPQDIFGNLDELCYVSYTFCKDFIAALLKDMSSTIFGRSKVLIRAFQRFSVHSKDGAVYHTYCINYSNALTYLEQLKRCEHYCEFEKWCEQDPRCNRLQLTDLLVAPLQHCTKLPLLLSSIRKYTVNEMDRAQLTESIEKVETSLKSLEDKMKWIKNYQRVQEIQQQLVWPSVAELDPRMFIPESLKNVLTKQPCSRLLACPKRELVYEGPVSLIEAAKTLEMYMFLFDDIFLITKVKKTLRKKQSVHEPTPKIAPASQTEKGAYTVYKQPIALDRFSFHDISQAEATATGIKHAFVVIQISRFQQIIAVYTFQAHSEAAKATWMNHIKEAKERYMEKQKVRQSSFKENRAPRAPVSRADRQSHSPRRTRAINLLKQSHAKSRSMDAVYL